MAAGHVMILTTHTKTLDVITGALVAHIASHHLEELVKLDGAVVVVHAVDVGDHLLELVVLDLEVKGTHGRT